MLGKTMPVMNVCDPSVWSFVSYERPTLDGEPKPLSVGNKKSCKFQ